MNKHWIIVLIVTTAVLAFFSGCGDSGKDAVEMLPGVKNPGVVQGVKAYSGNRRVRVIWTKLDDTTVTGYNVYRKAGAGGYNLIGSVGQSSPSYFQDEGDDSDHDGIPEGLTNYTPYFYKISAFNREGRETPVDSCPSVSATPGQLDPNQIDIAVERVDAYASKESAYISWPLVDNDMVIGYNVYRSVSGTAGFELVAITPPTINGYIDGGLSSRENYVYQVAPAINNLDSGPNEDLLTGFLEGRRSESRPVRPNESDSTIPKPPGSDPANLFQPKAEIEVLNSGKQAIHLQFCRPSANTDGTLLEHQDDLIAGSYLIFRASNIYTKYKLVGIIEYAGSSPVVDFWDTAGKETDYWYVKAGDSFGNISDKSDIITVDTQTSRPPTTVTTVTATSGDALGSIMVKWNPPRNGANADNPLVNVDSYNLYRSTNPDTGFTAIAHNIEDEDPSPEWIAFTDNGINLVYNQTYYYKVSVVGNGLESSMSPAAAAAPGPAQGIIVLEAENAVIRDRNPQLPDDGYAAAQFSPEHWKWKRQGYHSPFSGNGVLHIEPQHIAKTDHVNGERLDLYWRVEVPNLAGNLANATASANVYMITADDENTGIYKVFIDDREISRTMPPAAPTLITTQAFDGISTEINFRDITYSNPIQPTRRLLGRLTFDNLNTNDATDQMTDAETVYMSIIHTGPTQESNGYGKLKFDSLLLVLIDNH
jgi:hypothetical protein